MYTTKRSLLQLVRVTASRLSRIWLRNSSRVHLNSYNAWFAQRVTSGMFVLDAGSGTAPYRHLFSQANYETADFQQVEKVYGATTYVCDLAEIPVETQRFDHIVFNQVLEHVPDPGKVISELHRILKPGGSMICTCPLFYEEHEKPYDYYRYTRFAHRLMFERAGFRIEKIDWLEGYMGTLAYQLEMAARQLPVFVGKGVGDIFSWVMAPIVLGFKALSFLLAGIFYRIDIRYRLTSCGMPKNYVVIVTKA